MKRLIIVCEGPTEQEFCQTILAPYYQHRQIIVETPTIKHSNGGIVAWGTLKKQLIQHLNEGNVVVTTFIDFYRIKDSFRYPGWTEAKAITSSHAKMDFLFQQMKADIPQDLQPRFVPYIQLHEFEGLLFSDINAFKINFKKTECDITKIEAAISNFPNPEEINNGPNTAPSVRLLDAINGYNKDIYGPLLAETIGLQTIRAKCHLFDNWMQRLESTCQ